MGVLIHDHPEKLFIRSLSTLSLPRTLPPELTSTDLSTPPHNAMAAVPFRWEESPGKPKPCTASLAPVPVPVSDDKSLELPPRLLLVEARNRTISCSHRGINYPASVFDGSYVGSRSSRKLMSSSFRAVGGECYGSSRESGGETAALLRSRAVDQKRKKRWSWKLGAMKGKNEVGGGSYVFPSYGYGDQQFTNMITTRVDSHRFNIISQASKSPFWESIAEGLKQVVLPWRNKRAN